MKRCFLLLFPLFLLSQDEQLHIEVIDVYKDYIPSVPKSIKISEQPIFTDTLEAKMVSEESVVVRNLTLKENVLNRNPKKYSFDALNNDYSNFLYLNLGSKNFLNTKFHYTNSPSVRHNSGVYVEHDSQEYGIKAPNYKDYDGELFDLIGIYSNRFFEHQIFESSLEFNKRSGLYWGGLDSLPINSINNFIGNSLKLNLALIKVLNTSFLKSASIDFINFYNNYERNETFLSSSLNFGIEKALKTYSWILDLYCIQGKYSSTDDFFSQNFETSIPIIPSDFATTFANKSLDFGLSNNFVISGEKNINYHIGLNLSYFQTQDIDLEFSDISQKYLLFPNLHFSKDFAGDQRIDFLFSKNLKYQTFNTLFVKIPYSSYRYRNSISEELIVSFIYNNKLSNEIALFGDINYHRFDNECIPILLRGESSSNLTHSSNYLELYLLDFTGLTASSKLTLYSDMIDIFFKATYNALKSTDHSDKKLFPALRFHSNMQIKIIENTLLISDVYFSTKRDFLNMDYVNLNYVTVRSEINTNISFKYFLNDMIFSFSWKNILNHKLHFFDGYFDDNGTKISVGFSCKF
ncbi:hypothetical protein OAJ42_00695 [Flavobacteriales bacterium]|nr:hypothetical protein [Flavobacteriales bacterium]